MYYNLHKVLTKVEFPIYNLDMRKYVSPKLVEEGEDYLYDLIGVSCHSGIGPTGHYYCFCKDNINGVDQWFKYNDDRFSEISEKDVQTPDACLLVYSKKKNTISAKDVVDMIIKLRSAGK